MKILELEIKNIRGLPDLIICPNEKSFLISGRNGTGKSGIVDALDFLLTGQISRLTGEGTSGITLQKHGPHIGHNPAEAFVRAKIKTSEGTAEMSRCLASPQNPIYDKPESVSILKALDVASRGLHVLTRRNLLKFITAEAGTRAIQIQELLNLFTIEEIRKTFGKTQRETKEQFEHAKSILDKAEGEVKATLNIQSLDEKETLRAVNEIRKTLKGNPLDILTSSALLEELVLPGTVEDEKSINISILERDIRNINSILAEDNRTSILKNEANLRDALKHIKSNPELLRSLKKYELIELGIKLIDTTGKCPLCDFAWPEGELIERLNAQKKMAQEASQRNEQIKNLGQEIQNSITKLFASIAKLISAAELMGLVAEKEALTSWHGEINNLISSLTNPVDRYDLQIIKPEHVTRILAPSSIEEIVNNTFEEAKKKFKTGTPEQIAWKTLIRLENDLKKWDEAKRHLTSTKLIYQRARLLEDSFLISRDDVLDELYASVRDRFVQLYKELHGEDENNFTASLEPKKAKLDFEVDFYGYGKHPPHALHSEGHQDSMGLCLYLALVEKLGSGILDLIILDDVVMSVDAGHKRGVCEILRNDFPDRQFMITTHDETWAKQLRQLKIIDSENIYKLSDWKVESGPRLERQFDTWARIKSDLNNDDVPSAAHKLRWELEDFFAIACDVLRAPVPYRLDGEWPLEDFLSSAPKKYRKLLNKAKNFALSSENITLTSMIDTLLSSLKVAFEESQIERWAININVHYNSWVDMGKKDFLPVVKAFKDLEDQFKCKECGNIIHLELVDLEENALRCRCGDIYWRLR
jgi:DNA repair exonuclease SbcCD ATPase subunit